MFSDPQSGGVEGVMLKSLAIGDAYGIAWEFVRPDNEGDLVNDGQTYQQNPRYPELVPSQYTDDTLRSIATARVVMGERESAFNPLSYIAAIQQVYREDQRPGWSKRFQSYLETMRDRSSLDFANGITQRRDSNGALMGCLPVGFLASPVEVMLAAAAQAIATHSVSTVPYAQALALSAFHFRNGGSSRTLGTFLLEHVGDIGNYEITPARWTKMAAGSTAHAVLHIIGSTATESLSERLKWAVDLRGDTDSVAALVCGLSSLDRLVVNDLSPELDKQLDLGHGQDHLSQLDEQLQCLR